MRQTKARCSECEHESRQHSQRATITCCPGTCTSIVIIIVQGVYICRPRLTRLSLYVFTCSPHHPPHPRHRPSHVRAARPSAPA